MRLVSWQPIRTAPRDRLLLGGCYRWLEVMWWSDGAEAFITQWDDEEHDQDYVIAKATHWMELPETPQGFIDIPPPVQPDSWQAKAEMAMAEVERLRGLLKESNNALVSLTPNGSEFYVRDRDGYRVDVQACMAYILDKNLRQFRQIKDGVRARKELAKLKAAQD